MAKKFLGTVILPGMFDPVTTGHMNSLKYLSERSDKVYAVIMTLKSEEQNRWIPSETMKRLIEAAIAEEKLDNVSVYIESEGWLAPVSYTHLLIFRPDLMSRRQITSR